MLTEKDKPDPYSWSQKTINRLVLPQSFELRVAHGYGELMRRFPFELEELIVYVHNKLKHRDQSAARERSFLGRLWNRLFREDLEYVDLDGVALKQLYELMETDPPTLIELKGIYRVHHEELRRWYRLVSDAKTAAEQNE